MPSDFIFFSCLVRPSIVYRWYGKTILNRSSLFSWPQDLIWVSVGKWKPSKTWKVRLKWRLKAPFRVIRGLKTSFTPSGVCEGESAVTDLFI